MHSLIQIHVLLVFVEFIPVHVRALWQMRIKVERDLPLKLLLPFLQSLFHLMTLIYLKMIKKGTTYFGVHNKLLLLLYMYFTFFHISYYPNKSDFLELFNYFLNKKSWKKTTNKKKTTWITIQDESADLCYKNTWLWCNWQCFESLTYEIFMYYLLFPDLQVLLWVLAAIPWSLHQNFLDL